MSRTNLWIVTAALFLGAVYLWFFHMPSRQTELRSKGVREHGTVQMKDSHPVADGSLVYTVEVIFPDKDNRNHQVNIVMLDQGRWDSLKNGQDIIVYYMPNDPDNASTEGGQGLVAPHSSALNFLAWSLLIASGVAAYYAYKAPRPEPKGPQNKVTVSRH